MNKVQFFLFAIIFLSIAMKVSFTRVELEDYAALSTDTELEDVEQFFKYKVNYIQSENPYKIKSCMIQSLVCCHG